MYGMIALGAFAFAAVLASQPARAASPAAERCRAAKVQAVAKYVACRMFAERKLVLRRDVGRYDAMLAACEEKLGTAWGRAIRRASRSGGSCQDSDRSLVEYRALVESQTETLAVLLAGGEPPRGLADPCE